MHIDRALNGADLRGGELWLEEPTAERARAPVIGRSTRIGVDYAGDWAARPWRFFDRNSSEVSTARRRPSRNCPNRPHFK
jgi:DNA-3-methyladenine glycosylase